MKKTIFRKLVLAIVCAFTLGLINSCGPEEEPVTTGNIQGIVTDASNSEPIKGVNISLSPTGLSAVTGSDGRYEFTNLPAGQYTVQGVKQGYQSNTKNITIVAGNVSSGDMQLTPELADFKLNVDYLDFGTTFNQLTFKVTNTSNSLPISWSITESLNWLTATPSSGNLNAGAEVTVVVNIDRSLIDQSTSANITVSAAGKDIVLPVNVSLSGNDGPQLQVSETMLDFGSSATSLAFYVMNTGPAGTSLNWNCSTINVDWLSLNPTSGNTPGGSSTAVMATIDRNKIDGIVSTAITISGAGSSSTITVQASSEGGGNAILQLSEGSLSFGASQSSLTFQVKNVGTTGTVLDWVIMEPDVDWLTLTPMTGHTNSGSGTLVTAAVDRTKFTGTVSTTVRVNSQSNNATLSVSAENMQPKLEVSTETVNFGSVSTTQSFTIKNAGDEGTTLKWTMAAPTVNWLTATPLTGNLNAGSSKTVTLTIDRTKFTGDVSTSLVITAGNQNATVNVTASTAQTLLTVTPTTIDFGKITTTKTFTIKNEGEEGSVLNWNIATPSVNWLSVSPATGSLNQNGSRVVTLTLDRTKFTGDVSTTLQVTGDGQSATLNISASTGQPNLVVTPTTIDFGKLTSTKIITIKNNGEEGSVLNWNISTPTVDWLSATSLSGSTNANAFTNVTLAIDRSLIDSDVSTTLNVTAGTQTVQLTITASIAKYILQVTPETVDFGNLSNSKTFTIKNAGETGSNMAWNLEDIGVEWLSASPTSGNLSANQSAKVTLNLDRTKFDGNVSTILEVAGGSQNAQVVVTASTPVPALSVSPTSIDFGTISTTQPITISNTGESGSVLEWSIETPSVTWLTVTPMSGTVNAGLNATVNLTVDRNAFVGVQNTTITVTDGTASVTVAITIDNSIVVVNGLLAYYTFDDGTVTDWGGNYNGYNYEAVASTDTPGNEGKSMEFNGKSSYLRIPSLIFLYNTKWSYNCWIKTGSNNCTLIGTNNSDRGLRILDNSNLLIAPASSSSYNWNISSMASYLDNQWHMLTIAYDGSSYIVWVDGAQFYQTSSGGGWYSSLTETYIGVRKSNPMSSYFNGKMDNIRTYNRALTQAEVTAIYNARQ